MSELKTCPSCYKEACWYEEDDERPFQNKIICGFCALMTDGFRTKKEAIDAWNTRQPNPEIEQLKAEIAALRTQLEPIKEVYDTFIVLLDDVLKNKTNTTTELAMQANLKYMWQAIKKAVEDDN